VSAHRLIQPISISPNLTDFEQIEAVSEFWVHRRRAQFVRAGGR
jgi:hypothetical protein